MDLRSKENFLIQIMSAGFERAAASFSSLIGRKVKVTRSQAILVHNDDSFSHLGDKTGDLYILITQIIGDVSGKSFLIFNNEESQEIFKSINLTSANKALNEAFLLEIDNIISASVISELSNSLNVEVYGDVPKLIVKNAKELATFIRSEVGDENVSSMIFCNTTFQFDGKEKINPQFIWNLNSKIFETIPVS